MVSRARPSLRLRTTVVSKAIALAAAVVGADQLTKHTVAAGIAPGSVGRFLPGIDLVHVRNTGVAFSLFSGRGVAVLLFTLVALALLCLYLVLRPNRPWLWVPTGLLVGGAVGNLIDRILSGAVTDFIKLPLWPAFNIADIAITLGIIALLLVLEDARRGN